MPETDTKSVVDNFGNAAAMGAMAVPGIGAELSAVISFGLAIFDTAFDDGSGTPTSRPATDVDLDNAVADIKTAMQNQADQTALDGIYNQTKTFGATLAFGWQDLDTQTATEFFMLDKLNVALSEDDKASVTYDKKPILNGNSDFYNNLQTLIDFKPYEKTEHAPYQLQAMNIYLYVVNTYILYCKWCVILEYREDLHSDQYPQLVQLIKDHYIDKKDPALINEMKAWMKGGRKGTDPITARCKTVIKYNSPFVKILHERLEGASTTDPQTGKKVVNVIGYIDYLQEFYDAVQARYQAYETRVQQAANRVTIDGNHAIYLDGKFKCNGFDAKTANKIAQGYIGQIRHSAHKEEIVDHYVEGFDEHYRNQLLKIIGHWSEAKANALDFLSGYKKAEPEDGAET